MALVGSYLGFWQIEAGLEKNQNASQNVYVNIADSNSIGSKLSENYRF